MNRQLVVGVLAVVAALSLGVGLRRPTLEQRYQDYQAAMEDVLRSEVGSSARLRHVTVQGFALCGEVKQAGVVSAFVVTPEYEVYLADEDRLSSKIVANYCTE